MNNNILLKAANFAAQKHRDQRRKDVDATPYINHPIRVALTLSEAGEDDTALLAAALLHDTIEDTNTKPQELIEHFGEEICSLVLEVTDDKKLQKEERKQLQILNAPKKSIKAKKLKYADMICNLTDILEHPPHNWTIERKNQYFDWARQIGARLGNVNEVLEGELERLLKKTEISFGELKGK